MRKKISLLVPCFNEQDTLRNLHICVKNVADQHTEYDWEFLFVNDGSKDNTLTILRELREVDERVCYVDLSRNFGKENAMLAGFDYVTGDCAIVLDADLQDPPSLIPEMISWCGRRDIKMFMLVGKVEAKNPGCGVKCHLPIIRYFKRLHVSISWKMWVISGCWIESA